MIDCCLTRREPPLHSTPNRFHFCLIDLQVPPDSSGVDPQPTSSLSSSYPPNLQKPPVHLAHSQPSMHPGATAAAAVTSHSSGSLQFQPSVQLQSFNPVPGLGHGAPPPYAGTTEELSKEDVIFF